jgi:hypothetical protein
MQSAPVDYSNWSAGELIRRVTELERELREKNSRWGGYFCFPHLP